MSLTVSLSLSPSLLPTSSFVFVVKAEYEEEGIPWSHVDFSDNAEVLGLVESRMGVIAVLNEECVRPRGGDLSFVSKVRDVSGGGGNGGGGEG